MTYRFGPQLEALWVLQTTNVTGCAEILKSHTNVKTATHIKMSKKIKCAQQNVFKQILEKENIIVGICGRRNVDSQSKYVIFFLMM